MTRRAISIALRTLAVLVVALGWLDPSLAARSSVRVAVLDADRTAQVGAAVRAVLSPSFEVVSPLDANADAWVVVADVDEADVPAAPDAVALSFVSPPRPARELRLERLDAPSRVGRDSRATLIATFVARGMAGTTSQLAVRAGALELNRLEHRWTQGLERFVARFDLVPPAIGVNHLVVDVVDEAVRTHTSRGDAIVTVEDRPIPVLVFEGRPSWTTTFIRRALARDGRYALTFATRVSRGIAATSTVSDATAGRSPLALERLTASVLEPFAVAIVGAPETLAVSEVQALRERVTTRGGALVLAPDRRVTGPILDLLAGGRLDERLLADPIALDLVEVPGLRLLASELLESRGVAAGTLSLAEDVAGTPGSSSVLLTPIGNGQVLFVGALDAWRFRGRAGEHFDRWWPQVVEWLARAVPAPLSISLDRSVASPRDRVAVRVRVISDADRAITLSAAISPAADAGRREVVRMWPDSAPGAFVASINAPETPGVYAVSVTAEGTPSASPTTAHASLIVDKDARAPRSADGRWQAIARERRGVVVTTAELDRLTASLHALAPRHATASRRFPMRSAWWILPLAMCLGGEWWLRRRAGMK